ncbi:MAG: response regulator [Calditrichales bacterium]|nr:MAG: response regulator [Calditrichales bacterium]
MPNNACILLVEDEESMVRLIKYNLEKEGYICYSVSNGKQALAFCQNHHIDLIISDVAMPEMDGYEFREHLIESEKFKNIPFIFLTAKAQREDQLRGLSLGVDQFLTKPFEPDFLLMTVARILDR